MSKFYIALIILSKNLQIFQVNELYHPPHVYVAI